MQAEPSMKEAMQNRFNSFRTKLLQILLAFGAAAGRQLKIMARKCSHCGLGGHNSRTSAGFKGLRLFGVQLRAAASMKKSFSIECLTAAPSSSSSTPSNLVPSRSYHSDGLIAAAPDKKRGAPWTEEEHRLFLAGLERLGKGDWRGISRSFVLTRTPTQVASHAQKYFLRLTSQRKKKRHFSLLFDKVIEEMEAPVLSLSCISNSSEQAQLEAPTPVLDLELSIGPPAQMYLID